jgi:hypothetical protein
MLLLAAAALSLALPRPSVPQSAAEPVKHEAQIQFSFDNPKLDPSSYTLAFSENGSGHYKSTPGQTGMADDPQLIAPQPMDREVQIGEPLRSEVFHLARAKHYFALTCEAPDAHIAFTGTKTLNYTGPDGQGSCSFNYSRDQQLNKLAEDMMAVAYTLEEGRRLTVELQHGRLSLDSELEALQDAVNDHRAAEIANIAEVLEAISNDENVMNRARRRAQALLRGDTSKH